MKPQYSRKYITIEIRQPIYGNYVGIRDKFIFQAKRSGRELKIITPLGTTTISPTKYMKGADRIEKVFLDPSRPMVLYCKSLVPDKEQPEIVEDYSVPDMVRERLRERAVELGLTKKYEQRNLL